MDLCLVVPDSAPSRFVNNQLTSFPPAGIYNSLGIYFLILFLIFLCFFFKAFFSSPYTSPKASGPIDSQVLKNALARLNQSDSLERSFSSGSLELHSPEHRSPERTLASNTMNGALNGAHRPVLMNSAVRWFMCLKIIFLPHFSQAKGFLMKYSVGITYFCIVYETGTALN